jgi:hypothetical protein
MAARQGSVPSKLRGGREIEIAGVEELGDLGIEATEQWFSVPSSSRMSQLLIPGHNALLA